MQTRRPDQVVVAVPASDVATRSVAERWRSRTPFPIAVCPMPGAGVTDAVRAAVDAAVGDVVALTDDDAVPRPDWLERLGSHYRRPGVGGAGGRDVLHCLDGTAGGAARAVGRMTWYGRMAGPRELGRGAVHLVDLLKGVNLSLRRELWVLDPGLRGCGDDQPMWELAVCLRARSQGWKLVYDPAAVVDRYPAPRAGDRHPGSAAVRGAVAYNETLSALRWCRWGQKASFLAYALLVGSRGRPGLLAGLAQLGSGEPAAAAAVTCCLRARLAAVGAWMGGGTARRG